MTRSQKMFLILELLLCAFVVLSNSKNPDFYWRDFAGEPPEDAVPFSLDKDSIGQFGYIGRRHLVGLHGEMTTMLVYLRNATNKAVGLLSGTQGVEVLCSSHIENFKWQKVVNGKYRRETRKNSSTEATSDHPRYVSLRIARAPCDGSWRFAMTTSSELKMFYRCNGRIIRADTFRMLVYRTN